MFLQVFFCQHKVVVFLLLGCSQAAALTVGADLVEDGGHCDGQLLEVIGQLACGLRFLTELAQSRLVAVVVVLEEHVSGFVGERNLCVLDTTEVEEIDTATVVSVNSDRQCFQDQVEVDLVLALRCSSEDEFLEDISDHLDFLEEFVLCLLPIFTSLVNLLFSRLRVFVNIGVHAFALLFVVSFEGFLELLLLVDFVRELLEVVQSQVDAAHEFQRELRAKHRLD